MSQSCNVNYGGAPRSINATVLPRELREGIKKLKDQSAAAMRHALSERTQRKNLPKTSRTISHEITTETFTNGVDSKVKTKTTTRRKSN